MTDKEFYIKILGWTPYLGHNFVAAGKKKILRVYWWNLNHYKSKRENRLDCRRQSTQARVQPWLETQGRRHQKSKYGYQWPRKKDVNLDSPVCSKKKKEEKRPYLPATL